VTTVPMAIWQLSRFGGQRSGAMHYSGIVLSYPLEERERDATMEVEKRMKERKDVIRCRRTHLSCLRRGGAAPPPRPPPRAAGRRRPPPPPPANGDGGRRRFLGRSGR
jgi:hypothetical protein